MCVVIGSKRKRLVDSVVLVVVEVDRSSRCWSCRKRTSTLEENRKGKREDALGRVGEKKEKGEERTDSRRNTGAHRDRKQG